MNHNLDLKSLIVIAVLTSSLTACSSARKNEAAEIPPTAEQNEVSTQNTNSPEQTNKAQMSNDDFQIELRKIKDLAEHSQAALQEPVETTTEEAQQVITPIIHKDGVAPDVALRWLRNGNTRFLKGFLRADGQSKKDIQNLAQAQRPHSIILAGSDSRVPPEIVFDQKLGEIFTLRSLGPNLDQNAIASIEFAIEQLGVRNVVILGHSPCETVTAANNDKSEHSPALRQLFSEIRSRTQQRESLAEGQQPELCSINTKGIVADLQKRSKTIQQHVNSSHVKISTALYNIQSGQVDFIE